MADLGKLLVIVGVAVAAIGLVLILSGRLHLPLGRLPGDIIYRGKNSTVYFPIVTSIVLSVVFSAVLYLVSRFKH